MDDEDRTNAIGLFNFAHTYWVSAASLQDSPRKVTHPDAPVYYLYYHAIELYLKSFLRLKGFTVKQVRQAGHDAVHLCHEAQAAGLSLDEYATAVISTIPRNYLPARYIQTGYRSGAYPSDLWGVCHLLHARIEPLVNEAYGICRVRAVPRLHDRQPPGASSAGS